MRFRLRTLLIVVAHRDTWKPFDREPVIYDGRVCCIYVDEFGDGEIRRARGTSRVGAIRVHGVIQRGATSSFGLDPT